MKDMLGTRMKIYESMETQRVSMPRLPIYIRLDGRAFHTFTRGLDRPYDAGLSRAMIETTKYLVAETNACVGYTQSDEISLLLWNDSPDVEPLFGGKLHKLTSVLASEAAAKFNDLVPELIPRKAGILVAFDARVFPLPNLSEAANMFIWRWFDARRNSVSMAAQSIFDHKDLYRKDSKAMLQMLSERGIIWDSYPTHFKWGTFVQRREAERELTNEELLSIPEQYRPNGAVSRNDYVEIDIPPLDTIANRSAVLFEGATPMILGDKELMDEEDSRAPE